MAERSPSPHIPVRTDSLEDGRPASSATEQALETAEAAPLDR